jgi:hypothetical protein
MGSSYVAVVALVARRRGVARELADRAVELHVEVAHAQRLRVDDEVLDLPDARAVARLHVPPANVGCPSAT